MVKIEKLNAKEFITALTTISMCYPFITIHKRKYIYCISLLGEAKDIGQELSVLTGCKWKAYKRTLGGVAKFLGV